MAKAIGIEIEAAAVRVAAIDGTPKRFVLTDYRSVPIEREEEDSDSPASVADITRAIKAAMRDIKVKRENLGIAVDTSRAIIREHSLPFSGDDRIRQVLKFEIEGKLPQMGIDDVIVDYYVIEESEHQSKLLVAALPKKFLEPQIRAAGGADCDPQVADLSAFALFNAVAACGKVPAQGNAAFVHVLDDQILFLLSEDGALRQVRSLKGGAGTLERSVQRNLGGDASDATRALRPGSAPSPSTGGSTADFGDEDLVVLQDEAPPTMELASGEVGQDLMDRQAHAFVSRLTRDLKRTVFSLRLQRHTPVFVSGRVNELPGFLSEVATIFGGEARTLDLLESVEHSVDLEGDDQESVSDRVPVALGMALHMLGADFVGCNFRQEELRFARSFDLLKVPLAFGLFFLFLFLALENFYLFREINRKLVFEQMHEAERAATILIDADLEYAGYATGRQTDRQRWRNRLDSRLQQLREFPTTGKYPGWPKIDHLTVKEKTDDPLRIATVANNVLKETLRKLQDAIGGTGTSGGYQMPPSTLDALYHVFAAFDAVQKANQARIKIDSIDTSLIVASQIGVEDAIQITLRYVIFTTDVAVATSIDTGIRSKIKEAGADVDATFSANVVGSVGSEYDMKIKFTKAPKKPEIAGAPAGE